MRKMMAERKLAIVAWLYDKQCRDVAQGKDGGLIEQCHKSLVYQLDCADFQALNDIKGVANLIGLPPRHAGIIRAHNRYHAAKATIKVR